MTISNIHDPINDWIPETEFLERYPHITRPTLRWQLTNRRNNGLDTAVKVIGRRRFISVTRYSTWINDDHAYLYGKDHD
jgi:hypothetical protein